MQIVLAFYNIPCNCNQRLFRTCSMTFDVFSDDFFEMDLRSKTQEPKADEQQAQLSSFLLLLRRRLLFQIFNAFLHSFIHLSLSL